MLCKVTNCAGRVSANTRPHQLRWGDREIMHAHMYAHTCRTHTHTRTHIHIRTHTRTYTHTYIHRHTNTHAHTHKQCTNYMHTCVCTYKTSWQLQKCSIIFTYTIHAHTHHTCIWRLEGWKREISKPANNAT